MNKKGFTLVELLVVIAILGALLVLALPRITETVNKSRKDVFHNEILEIYKTSIAQKQVDNDGKRRSIKYCRENGEDCEGEYHSLDLSGSTKVDYIVVIDAANNVTHFEAKNDRFKFYYDGEGLLEENILVDNILFADEAVSICFVKGDVNGDGAISSEDSDLVLSYFTGTEVANDNQKIIGDMNCDGTINSVDASFILQIANNSMTYDNLRKTYASQCSSIETSVTICNIDKSF